MSAAARTLAEIRQDYADWYVREQLARRHLDTVEQGRVAMAQMQILTGVSFSVADALASMMVGLGVDPPPGLAQIFSEETITALAETAQWLVGEAEYHRMHAEALLRTYGEETL